MRKRMAALLLSLTVLLLCGCAAQEVQPQEDGKLNVVCSLFPYYDFARAIGGEYVNAQLLVPAGRETHSFEPTPLDVIKVSRADVLIYNGGHGEYWVSEILGSAGEDISQVVCMMDHTEALEGRIVEGMEAHAHHHHHSQLADAVAGTGHGPEDHEHTEICPEEHEACPEDHVHTEACRHIDDVLEEQEAAHVHTEACPPEHDHGHEDEHGRDHNDDGHAEHIEYDEHIWTSPVGSQELCRAIAQALIAADPAHADAYRANLEDYIAQLQELDGAFRQVVEEGNRNLLVFGDRFPMLYFCDTYGLDYRAAFHGCAGDTEPSLETLKYLIDKVESEDIPVIYTIELSSQKIANAIAETTGARVRTIHSCQTVSREEFDAGETYLSIMWRNVDALKEGLA